MKRELLAPKNNTVRLLLDSGAYSAWRKGAHIDIKDYIAYCVERKHLIHKAVNLDEIPGNFNSHYTTSAEVEESAKRSYANQQRMKEAGLSPIPVYHQGERLHWLEQMLRDGEPYIGLSPRIYYRTAEKMQWLDSVFDVLTNSDGRPFVQTHGFACTSLGLIASYPWRSVDSTTWVLTPGYGQIIVPALIDGGFDYTHATRVIVSGVIQRNRGANAKRVEVLPDNVMQAVDRFVTEVAGSSLARVRYCRRDRNMAMLKYYLQLNKQLYDVRHSRSSRLSGPDHLDTSKFAPCDPWNIIQYFVTYATNHEWASDMTSIGANDRLVSYWELRKLKGWDERFERWVQNGRASSEPFFNQKIKPDWASDVYRARRSLLLHLRATRGTDHATS